MIVEKHVTTKFRIAFDGERFKIQFNLNNGGWKDYVYKLKKDFILPHSPALRTPIKVYYTRFKWIAKMKLRRLEKAEANRQKHKHAIWEVVK